MNEQVRAVFNMCDGFQSELNRIHKAEAEHEQAHLETANLYSAELIDHAMRGDRIHFCGKHKHNPFEIIADELNEEAVREMICWILWVKTGRMTQQRAIELLSDRVNSAVISAGLSYASLTVGK